MSDDNLELWHKVEKTNPQHTKAITGKQYKGTSPRPYWLIQRATEIFGPVGIGWGFSIDERIENGALIAPGFYERVHIAKVRFWYKWKGERGEVEHIGGTPFSGKRSNGNIFTDDDSAKKSVTDALVKAMSMVGFAGDIFIGRYDDSKYVEEIAQEFEQDREARAKAEQDRLIHGILDAFLDMGTSEALVTMWKERVVPNAADFSDENKARLREAYVARGKVLREKERKQQEDGGHE